MSLCRCLGAALVLSTALALPALGFDLQGHRGARGLAPENTLPAFERALALGVTTLELDVGLTADGAVVVSHDPALNPAITRDASGQWLPARGPLLRSLALAQLRSYDVGRIRPDSDYGKTFASQQGRDGVRIPTLEEVFALARQQGADAIRYNIETKLDPGRPQDTASPQELVQALLQVVREAGVADRVTVQSFDWRSLKLVQQLAPEIPTACLTIRTLRSDNLRDGTWTAGLLLADHGSVPRLVKAAGCRIWSPNAGALTEALLREAQGLGLQVVPWTVNETGPMEKLVGWGVNGLITDYPDRLQAVLRSRGITAAGK